MVQKDVCSPLILRGLGVQKKIYKQTTSNKEEALLKSAHNYLDQKGDDESS